MADNPSNRNELPDTFQAWISVHGKDEYGLFIKQASSPHLSYEEWSTSEHTLGPYLYQLTLDTWNEESSSEDEGPVTSASSRGPKSVPAETVTTNGNGLPHADHMTSSATDVKVTDSNASPKKRRKSRKKILSEEIIALEDVDESTLSAPETRSEEPKAATKKRKPQKRIQSEPAIPPEDIEQPTPVASTPVTAAGQPDGPSPSSSSARRGLRIRTPAQQRPYYHHARIFEEAGATDRDYESSRMLNSSPKSEHSEGNIHPTSGPPTPSLAAPKEVPPRSNVPRRKSSGKGRPWKKDDEEDDEDYHGANKKKPKKQGRPRKSLPSKTKVKNDPDSTAGQVEVSPIAPNPKPAKQARKARRSHLSQEFVRDESDSDANTLPQVPPPASASVDVEATIAPAQPSPQDIRPKRKPRKSYISQEFVVSDSDSEGLPDAGAIEAVDEPRPHKEQKNSKKSRKSHISQEFVVDDSDSEGGVVEQSGEVGASKPGVGGGEKMQGKMMNSEDTLDGSSRKSTPKAWKVKGPSLGSVDS